MQEDFCVLYLRENVQIFSQKIFVHFWHFSFKGGGVNPTSMSKKIDKIEFLPKRCLFIFGIFYLNEEELMQQACLKK